MYVVGLGLNSQRASFYSNTKFFYYSFTTKSLLPLIFIKGFFLSFKPLLSIPELIISFMATIACRFIQGRYMDRYLGSRN